MDAAAQRRAVCCELVCEVARTSGEVRLKVTGASMLPAILPGDVITVRPCDFADLQRGHIVMYRRHGRLTAHRIEHISRDHLITRGDSLPSYDPPVRASEVAGRVVNILRNGRLIHSEPSIVQRSVSAILRRSDFCTRIALRLLRVRYDECAI